jgi:hypothetical protein
MVWQSDYQCVVVWSVLFIVSLPLFDQLSFHVDWRSVVCAFVYFIGFTFLLLVQEVSTFVAFLATVVLTVVACNVCGDMYSNTIVIRLYIMVFFFLLLSRIVGLEFGSHVNVFDVFFFLLMVLVQLGAFVQAVC